MSRAQVTAVAIAVALLIAGASYYLGRSQGAAHGDRATPPAAAASTERKILYWQDPMVPGQKFDKPGKSPFMDMPLQPVYADQEAGSGVKVSPQVTA